MVLPTQKAPMRGVQSGARRHRRRDIALANPVAGGCKSKDGCCTGEGLSHCHAMVESTKESNPEGTHASENLFALHRNIHDIPLPIDQ